MDKKIYSHEQLEKMYEEYYETGLLRDLRLFRYYYIELTKYVIEEKLKMSDDDILKISRKWFQKYGFYSTSLTKFRGNTYQYINTIYPDKFKPWQFITVGSEYWKDDINIKNALLWLIDKCINDKIIKNANDIPKNITINTFRKYRLNGLLASKFNTSPYYAFEYLYPNKFYTWEYQKTVEGYWKSKENRINAIKQLIENRLNINITDIPKIISFEYLVLNNNCKKFKVVCNKYYNFDIWKWLKECYPKEFNNWDIPYKNHYMCLDGIRVMSEPERMLHHIFIKNFKDDIKYNGCSFYDDIKETNYIPDWILSYNNKIVIIEFYGYIRNKEYDTFSNDIGYIDKHKDKEIFYKDLCKRDSRYLYMPLYYDDIKNNYSKLISKFSKQFNINLIIE